MRKALPLVAMLFFSTQANAQIVARSADYKDGGTSLKGTLVFDDAVKTARPGVVVYPEWWGANDYAKRRATEVAQLGYVALVADMYGDGKSTTDPKQATEWTKPLYADRNAMRARARAAVDYLQSQPNVDRSNIALIGFCFGGTNALELARAGDDIKGVVGFHAGLDFPDDVKKGAVKARVLVLNGGADPHVKLDADEKFIEQMQEAGADVEVDLYGNAQHAFTNPDAGKFGLLGIGYDQKAETRSMAKMRDFFANLFSK